MVAVEQCECGRVPNYVLGQDIKMEKRFFSLQWWSDFELRFGSTMNLVAGGTVLLMAFFTVADITGRVFSRPIPGTYELVELMMAPTVFLALFYAQRKGSHIRVEIVTQRLPARARAGLDVLAFFIGAVIFAITSWHLFAWGWQSWLIREVALGQIDTPVYPFKFLGALGCLLLALRYFGDAIRCLINTVRWRGH